MSIDYLKRCRHCDEVIGSAAWRCPKCQSWQSRRGDAPDDRGWWWSFFLFLLLLLFCGGQFLAVWNRRGADFALYRDQIEVVDARMEFNDKHGERKMLTVGMLKNHSSRKWRDVVIEVQYFDRDGLLVGTKSSRCSDLVLLPETEHAFQVTCSISLSEARFVSQKVFVRDAREATNGP